MKSILKTDTKAQPVTYVCILGASILKLCSSILRANNKWMDINIFHLICATARFEVRIQRTHGILDDGPCSQILITKIG